MVDTYLKVFRRSATWSVPIVAHAAVLWGILFIVMGNKRRGGAGLRTTIGTMPPWAWGILMIAGGLSVLIWLKPWTVAALSFVLSFYVLTLLMNLIRYDNASWTAPIWPTCATVVLIVAGGRLGVRKTHHDIRR